MNFNNITTFQFSDPNLLKTNDPVLASKIL